MINKLPSEARKLWDEVYKKSISNGKSETEASNFAWTVIKKVYSKSKEWQKNDIKVSKTITKSNSDTTYYMDGILSLPGEDSSSQYNNVSTNLLNKFINPGFLENYGTIEHQEFEKDLKIPFNRDILKGKEPYLLDSSKVIDKELHIRFKINKEYPEYDNLINYIKQGNLLSLSAEFKDAITYGNTILDASKLGWTVTNNPAQKKARIYKITKQNGRN